MPPGPPSDPPGWWSPSHVASKVEAPITNEQTLWRLTKGDHVAEARVRPIERFGIELRAADGVDPIQLGVVFLANMELGYLTPPVGLNVYMSSYRFGKPVREVFRAVLPIIVVPHIGVLLITFVPWLTIALPHWAAR